MVVWKQAQSNHGESSQEYIHSLLASFINEDPILGKKLLEGAFSWIDHTKEYESVPTESLREYLDYRSRDIGTEYDTLITDHFSSTIDVY